MQKVRILIQCQLDHGLTVTELSSGLPSRSKRIARSSPRKKDEVASFAIHQDDSIGESAECIQIECDQTTLVKAGTRIVLSPRKANAIVPVVTGKEQVVESVLANHVPTPKTPRRRDALSKQRVGVAGIPLTPRTPRTPRTPSQHTGAVKSIFNAARRVFSRGAEPGPIVGRRNEREELEHFVTEAVQKGTGGCLYVSGPPGTGKSALVGEICEERKRSDTLQFAYINCMSVKNAGDVYTQLVSELEISDDVFGSKAKEMFAAAITSKQRPSTYLVVLDEIDQLLSFDLDILYSLFEWSLQPTTNVVLIGIANALDLTDRFLPRLRARNLKPQLLPFLPYSVSEISSVILSRARSLLSENAVVSADFAPFLAASAIQLISKKVAAQTGDLRKAFDLAQKSIDLVEGETRDTLSKQQGEQQVQSSPSRPPLGENANLTSPKSQSAADTPTKPSQPVHPSLTSYTAETAPRATLSHVLRVTNLAFNATSTTHCLKALNLQQKAALCSMAALEHRARSLHATPSTHATNGLPSPLNTPTKKRLKTGAPITPSKRNGTAVSTTSTTAPTIREVYDAYATLCTRENLLHPLTYTEFRDVVDNLENAGLVSSVDGKGSYLASMPGTPSKRRGGGGFGGGMARNMGMGVEERRVKGTVGREELLGALEGPGAEMLRRMVGGVDL